MYPTLGWRLSYVEPLCRSAEPGQAEHSLSGIASIEPAHLWRPLIEKIGLLSMARTQALATTYK